MRALVIHGSPRMERGTTSLILGPFITGMREAGAEVELVYTHRLSVLPCEGELICWIDTPGQCHHQDDMQELYPRLMRSQIWVLATPVYLDGMSAPLKGVLDRLLPLAHPFVELRDGRSRHRGTPGRREGKVVLVATCGLWEEENFEPLVHHMRAICASLRMEFAGALLRPHAPALMELTGEGQEFDDVFEAARCAGQQLIRDGRMADDTLRIVARPLMPVQEYVRGLNLWFQRARGEVREEKRRRTAPKV